MFMAENKGYQEIAIVDEVLPTRSETKSLFTTLLDKVVLSMGFNK